jgi:hypothetical protein
MRSYWTIGLSFIAGSAMTVLGTTGTAGAQDDATAAAAEAQARTSQAEADSARDRADELAKAGGWPYKTGLIDQTNREAARHEARADEAQAVATGAAWAPYAVSPRMAELQDKLADEKAAGGWAWKTGTVARTEAEMEALKAPTPRPTIEPGEEVSLPPSSDKPVITVERTFK